MEQDRSAIRASNSTGLTLDLIGLGKILDLFLSAAVAGLEHIGKQNEPTVNAADPASPPNEDQALLRRFSGTRDEAAFRALVEKYTSLVFGVATRRTGNPDVAEEVLQNVFLALAKKAGSLGSQRSLGAWLHRAATLESLKSLRDDATRQRHLAMIRDQQDPDATADDEQMWREVRPHLDELLDRLPARDREIVVAHYFGGLAFAEIAARFGTTAAAAQKRSVRALKKLAALLKKRGALVPATALAAGLGAELAPAAPASLATGVATKVLGTTAPAATTATGATSFTSIVTAMSTSKIAIAASFIIAASVPVGLHIGSTEAAYGTKVASGSPSTLSQPKNPTGSPAFSAGDFRAELQRITGADESDPARTRRLQRLIFTLDLDQVQEAVAVLEEFEEPKRLYDIIGTCFARWAELDPHGAIAGAVSRPPGRWGYYPIHGAWDTWAYADWEAAREWITTTETEYDHPFMFWGYFDHMAKIDGALGVARARQLGADFPERAEQYLSRAVSSWTKNQPEEAIGWIDQEITEPVRRDQLIGKALQALGRPDPQAALSRVDMIGNADRRIEVRYNIFWTWALQQPHVATGYFVESKAGDRWDGSTVRSAGEAFARNLPQRAVEISRAITDPEKRDQFYCGILCGALDSDPSVVLEAAEGIGEEMARTNSSLSGFLRHWEARDHAAAEAWVESLPDGAKKDFARHMFPRAKRN